MKKSVVITAGIGAVVFGSLAAYQFLAKPEAANQVELMLANIQTEIAARGDGSEFTYGDVKIEGLSAIIPDIHYVDGANNMVSDIENAKISATNGHIRSAELTNWVTSGSHDQNTYEAVAASTIIDNLKFPEDTSTRLLIGDITFDKVALQDVVMTFKGEDFSVTGSYDKSELLNKSADSIASAESTNIVVSVAPFNFKVEMPASSSENMHLPAELNLMSSPEEMLAHYAKFFSENSELKANFFIDDEKIGDMSTQSTDVKAGESGFPVSGKSVASMQATASREQIIGWAKSAAAFSEGGPEEFNEAEFIAVLDQLGIDQYKIGMDVNFEMTADGKLDFDLVYDLGELGELGLNAALTNYDNEKIYSVIGMTDPTHEPTEEEMLEAFGDVGISKADITYKDGVLADFLLDIDPTMPREQMMMMSQLMIPGMLGTEPTLAQPAAEAVANFINGANGFEIHAAPSAPVTINELVDAVSKQAQIAPILNITISGE